MKKLITILLAISSLFSVFATTYTIETKYGTEQVVVPEGYTTEQVLLVVSKSYYEQNHEYKELQSKVEDLTLSVNSYIEENKSLRSKYTSLIEDYDFLLKKLEAYDKLGGFIKMFAGVHYTKGLGNTSYGFGVNFGTIVLNRVVVEAQASYPWSVTVSASYLFD